MKVKVLYFASLKERLLKGEDTVELPEDVKTVEDLINYLSENDASERRRRSGIFPAGHRRLNLN